MVENYAVVERVRVRFGAGLNLLTGETGSGKSLVVDALGLLLGGRASAEMVRSDTDRARISGIFEAPQGKACEKLLDQAGVQIEEGEILIEREILGGGKSRCFLGNRPVTAALLRELAPLLGDIHGQHEQQELFSARAQLELLDDFAGAAELRTRIAELFHAWQRLRDDLEELNRSEQEQLRLADLLNFQRKEIEAAVLQPGEDVRLEQERVVLKNVAKLEENAGAVYSALYDAPESAAAVVRGALKRLEDLSRIDSSLAPVLDTLKSAGIGVEEVSDAMRDYLGRLEADPNRLEEVESRLAALDRLKRKYGSTLAEVLAFLGNVRVQLEAMETASERRAVLERELAQMADDYSKTSSALTDVRKGAAGKLAAQVEKELDSLALENATFQVEIQPASWSECGADNVGFRISANAGDEPRPLDKVASGGELSRIALALKTCLRHSASGNGVQRTLVFDEIDAGIGGRVAEAVGRRLKKLSASNQVLCVTHLAQVAGFADHHYLVEKREVKGRTMAEVEELTGEARTREIGRMLSGQRVTPEALKHAEQLIRLAAEPRR